MCAISVGERIVYFLDGPEAGRSKVYSANEWLGSHISFAVTPEWVNMPGAAPIASGQFDVVRYALYPVPAGWPNNYRAACREFIAKVAKW